MNTKRVFSLVLSLVMLFGLITTNVFALDEYEVTLSAGTFEELTDAINTANDKTSALINLTSDITVTSVFPSITSDIAIKGEYTIWRDNSYTGRFFSVDQEASLTLDGGITIDGNHKWTFDKTGFEASCDISDGKFEIYQYNERLRFTAPAEGAPIATAAMFSVLGNMVLKNVTVQNHYGNSSCRIITLAGTGTLTMYDGTTFKHNMMKGGYGTIVYMSKGAEFTIEGGKITDTYAIADGGCIHNDGGLLIMNGGNLYDNKAVGTSGVVIFINQSDDQSKEVPGFIMNGGDVCGNVDVCSWLSNGKRSNGGAIFIEHAYMQLNGGKICHNIGATAGGIGLMRVNDKLHVAGGQVVENVNMRAVMNHAEIMDLHDICADASHEVVVTDGIFSQEIIQWMDTTVYGTAIEFLTGESGAPFIYYTVTTDLVKNERTDEIYHSFSAADKAAQAGDKLVMLENTRIYGTPEVISQDVTIDLDNKALYGWNNSLTTMFDIKSDVTVIPGGDDGMIDAARKSNASIFTVTDGGALTVEDGTYRADGNIATVENGELDIENGYYDTIPVDGKYALDCNDSNYVNGTANIITTGGTFTNFDPEDNGAEGDETDFCTQQFASNDNGDNSWTVVPADPVCRNVQTEKYYKNVKSAIKEVLGGQTVQLIKSTSTVDLILPEGTEFDLNGFALEAENVVGVTTTKIFDSTNNASNGYKANGLLKINSSNLILPSDNGAIPVYVPSNGGYIFVDFLFNSQNVQFDGISRVNMLATTRTMQVINLLKNGADDNDIEIVIRLTVNGNQSEDFAFTDYTVNNVMSSNRGKFNLFDRMFYANFTGIDEFESVTAQAVVLAHGNVVDAGDLLTLK